MVRSRGEAIIYNCCHALGLPFVYEDTVWLTDKKGNRVPVSSDFHFLLQADVVWEHAGLFRDAEYRKEFLGKIELYYDNGYTLGDTLIITMDDCQGDLNSQAIQRIAEELAAR